MNQQQFDKHFNLNSFRPEQLRDSTPEKDNILRHSVAIDKAQIFETKTIPPFVKIMN